MGKVFVSKLSYNSGYELFNAKKTILPRPFIVIVDIPDKVSHQIVRDRNSFWVLLPIKILLYLLKEGNLLSGKFIGIVRNLWTSRHAIYKNILIMFILRATIGKQVKCIVNLSLMQVKAEFNSGGICG